MPPLFAADEDYSVYFNPLPSSLTLTIFVKHKGKSTLANDFKGKNMNLL